MHYKASGLRRSFIAFMLKTPAPAFITVKAKHNPHKIAYTPNITLFPYEIVKNRIGRNIRNDLNDAF